MLYELNLKASIFNEIYLGNIFTFDCKKSFNKGEYILLKEINENGAPLDRFCIVKVLYSMELVVSKFQKEKTVYIIAVDIKSGFRPSETIDKKSNK